MEVGECERVCVCVSLCVSLCVKPRTTELWAFLNLCIMEVGVCVCEREREAMYNST